MLRLTTWTKQRGLSFSWIDANKPWVWLGLLLLGLVVRVWGLTAHSLDFDESWSLYLARLPLETILSKALGQGPDPHPPLYFLMLRAWISLFGDSEVALRGLSVLAGVILVALMLYWASSFVSFQTGFLAALLAALNPYLVWYSQEVRMYIWVATFGLASVVALARALRSGSAVRWVIYFLLGLAALYTHIIGAIIFPIHLLLIMLFWEKSDRRRRWIGVLSVGFMGLAYAPYAYYVWSQGIGTPAARIYPDLGFFSDVRNLMLTAIVHVVPLSTPLQALVLTLGGGLAVVGLWSIASGTNRDSQASSRSSQEEGIRKAFFISLFFVLPVLTTLLRSLYHPKFVLLAALPLLFLWTEGIRAVGRYFPALAMLVAVFLTAFNIYGLGYNLQEPSLREDWRTAGSYLSEHTRPEDAMLVHLEHYYLPLQYYYRGPAPVTHPFGSQIPNLESVEEILKEYERYETLWLILSAEYLGDPEGIVESWFHSRYPMVTEIFPARIRIQGYAIRHQFQALPSNAQPIEAQVGKGLHLRGFLLDQTRFPATSQALHPPSNWVHVTLFWETVGKQDAFQVRVEMVDQWGQVWGGNLPQTSGLQAVYPPEKWRPGEILRDDYDMNLNPVTPAGDYWIIVKASDLTTGEPLPLEQDGKPVSAIVLTEVGVVE